MKNIVRLKFIGRLKSKIRNIEIIICTAGFLIASIDIEEKKVPAGPQMNLKWAENALNPPFVLCWGCLKRRFALLWANGNLGYWAK